jgi:gamma-glutamyl-gamma-aminobutyrate hydrolase PuuD
MYISETNREIMVTSTHHQMMIPEGRYDMLAWAFNRAFKEELEPEVVYYPDTRCLAVQYHPEYMPRNTAGWQYFQTLIKEYIL